MQKPLRPFCSVVADRARLQSNLRRRAAKQYGHKLRIDTLEDRTAPAVGTIQFATADSQAGESASPSIAVTLVTTPNPLNGTVTADITRTGGTATSGADFTPFPTTTISFSSADSHSTNAVGDWVYTKSAPLALIDDRRVEASETVAFTLSNVVLNGDGISLGSPAAHTLTVLDNDSADASATGSSTATEGGAPAIVPVTLTLNTTGSGTVGLDVPVGINLAGPGSGTDYNFPAAPMAAFATGDGDKFTVDVSVAAVNDAIVEGPETFPLTTAVASSGGANVTTSGKHDLTVADNDSATLSIATGTTTAVEGGADGNVEVTLTITADGSGTPMLGYAVTADLTPGDTGADGVDFTTVATTFAADSTSGAKQNIVVKAANDKIVEGSESVGSQTLNITPTTVGAAVSGASGTQTIQITDNDTAKITFADATSSATEGSSATIGVTLTITGNGVDGDGTLGSAVSIDLAGPAGSAADITVPATPAVTFAAGSSSGTQTASVAAVDDRLVETITESFALTLANLNDPTGQVTSSGTNTLTVTDNDKATVSVAAGTTSVTEGGASQNVTATLSITSVGSGTEALAVAIKANLPGNADYLAAEVTFASGAVNNDTALIAVSAVDDKRVEAKETFPGEALAITDKGGADVTAAGARDIEVIDNDKATVTISAGTTTVAEGGASQNVVATLTLQTAGSVGAAGLDVPVSANLPGNADYGSVAASFAAGSADGATANVVVSAEDDQRVEATSESFPGEALTITDKGGADVTAAGTRDIVVTENDSATVAIATGTTTAAEGGPIQNVTATITLNTSGTGTVQLDVPVEVDLTPADDDFTTTPATFAAGSGNLATMNVGVTAVDDQRVEPITESTGNYALTVTKNGGANVTVGGSSGTTTINVTDNDKATVSIAGGTTAVTEGGASQPITATLKLNTTGTGAAGMDVAVSANLPGNPDYTAGAASFGVGAVDNDKATVTVTAVDDQLVEATKETFAGEALTISVSGGADVTAAGSETIEVTDNDKATVAITTSKTTVAEGGPTKNVTATLTLSTTGNVGTAQLAVPVEVDLTPGDDDFTTAKATFAVNSTNGATVDIGVTAVDDQRVEPATEAAGDHTLIITNTGAADVTVGGTSGTQTIEVTDNDSATVTYSGAANATEGGATGTLTATLSLITTGTGTAQLDTPVSATITSATNDFTADTVTWNAGDTPDARTITVTAEDDQLVEPLTENLTGTPAVTTAANFGSAGTAAVNVTDNDKATVSITGGTTAVTEGGSTKNVVATLTLNTSGSGPAQLAVPISANLPGNLDYTATAASFAAGATDGATANVVVGAFNDRLVEAATETFGGQALMITASGGADISASGSETVEVTDDESATISVAAGTTTVAEGGPAQNVTTTLAITSTGTGSEELAVALSVNLPGNADYTATQATFGVGAKAGATTDVAVSAVNDNAVEAFTETFAGQTLGVSNGNGANASATGSRTIAVTENDRAKVTYSGTANLTEGNVTPGLVTATLSLVTNGTGPVQLDVPVSATITSAASDFTAATVSWAAGEAPGAKDIAITVIDDRTVEATTEALSGNLSPSSAATVEADGSAAVNVTDNDKASVSVASGTTTVTEGGAAQTVVATLALTATGTGPVQLGVPISATLPGNAEYTAGTAAFTVGAADGATANIPVTAVDDATVEATESIPGQAVIAVSDATVTATGSRTLQVVDNDTGTFTIGDASATEGGTITFTISLDKAIDIPVTIDVNYDDLTAAGAGVDYTSAPGVVTFAAGATGPLTVTVNTTDDSFKELAETFLAKLSTATALGDRVVVLTDTGTGTIIDNDNSAPTVGDRTLTLAEDTSISATLTGTDPEGDSLTFAVATQPAHGTVNLDTKTGSFTYTPAGNYNGADTFTYKANDGNLDSNTATVSITVTAVNDAPVAANGSAATDEDTGLSGNVSATDADGDTLTFSLVTGPAHGSVTVNGDGTFTYTPAGNFNGADSFTFQATDGTLPSNTATFSITVNPVNDAPVAIDGTATTNEDTVLVGSLSASDVDGDTLTYSLVSAPTHGTVTIGSNGTYTYTPGANYNGPDAFAFKASDGTVDSGPAAVAITVNAVNDAPVANGATLSTDEDTVLTGNVVATDVDLDTLTYAVVTTPAHGSVTVNPDGSFTYTPTGNYNGPDSFTFKASDGTADSNTATVNITVVSVNDAPVAAPSSVSTNEDAALIGSVSATDADGNALTYSLVSAPTHGTVTVNGNGTFVYTPAADYNGPDSFTFKANDGTTDSNTATVNVTVVSVNDAPVAANASFTTNEDTAVSGTVAATDVDNPTLTFSVVTGPAHGSLTLNTNGSFTYTPAGNYNGPDSFTFRASDGTANSNTATVTLTVTPVNDNPTANADGFSVAEDSPTTTLNVLANDSIAPDAGETLTITAFTPAASGTVAVVNGGTALSYKPNANYNGSDTFTYTISDGNGGTATGTVTLNVVSVNDLPTAGNDTATVVEDSVANTINVLANDSFTPDAGETLTVLSVTQGQHGTVAISPNGLSVTYTPAKDYAGGDTFFYTVSDGNGGTAVGTVVVEVTNDAADRLEVVTTTGVSTFTEVLPPAVAIPVAVDPGIQIGPGLEGVIKSATVKIGNGYVRGKDRLVFTPIVGNPVRGTFDPLTGKLVLRGPGTQEQYEAALQAVKFVNTKAQPVDGIRVVTFQLRDAAGFGTEAAKLVRVVGVNTPATLTLAATSVNYTRGKPSVAVAGNLTIKDLDNTRLQSAQVRIIGFTPGKDQLTAILKPGIAKSYDVNTGILTLTGSATVAAYLAVLRSLRFSAPLDAAAGPRSIEFTVNDGTDVSNTVTRTVNVA